MMNLDNFIIDNNIKEQWLKNLKTLPKDNFSDCDTFKFLKSLLLSAIDFSYKSEEEFRTNQINLCDFLAYILVKHYNDEGEGKDEEYIFNIINTLFKESVDIKIPQIELNHIFVELQKVVLSTKTKRYFYDMCYLKHIIRNKEFYKENMDLDLNSKEKKYYENKEKELTLKANEFKRIYYEEIIFKNPNFANSNKSTYMIDLSDLIVLEGNNRKK